MFMALYMQYHNKLWIFSRKYPAFYNRYFWELEMAASILNFKRCFKRKFKKLTVVFMKIFSLTFSRIFEIISFEL